MAATELTGRVVVITGASMGIGEVLARQLVGEGALVVLAARSEDKLKALEEELGSEKALAVVCDVTKRQDHQTLLQKAIAKFGHVDVWVNNAGRGIWKSSLELTDEDFDEMMLVNVKSVLYGVQTVVPHFRERGQGHVINVSSLLGRIPYVAYRSAYNAAKHALNSLTVNFRQELRAEGLSQVHVSLVLPGVVYTEFGLNALHGGIDNRTIPGAQPVEEVGEVIMDCMRSPRAEVYTRPQYKEWAVDYYKDVEGSESKVPFTLFGPPKPST